MSYQLRHNARIVGEMFAAADMEDLIEMENTNLFAARLADRDL